VKSLNIYAKLPFSSVYVGLPTSKVGITTGWTRGTVTRTCINVSYTGENLVCQNEASYYRQPGDSGAPVFFDGATPVGHHLGVQLLGTHAGPGPDNPNYGVFSSIQGIEADFGITLSVCDPADGC